MPLPVLNGIDVNGQKVTSVADGTSSTDAVNRGQLDAAVAGMLNKGSVRASSTTNVDISTDIDNGSAFGGVTLATGDLVLLMHQTAGEENGIRVVPASGSAPRATNADTDAEVKSGMVVFVREGTNAGKNFQLTTPDPITLDTTSLTFVQTGAGSSYTAGDGLTLTGSDFDVNVDGTTIEISSDTLRIAATAAGSGLTGGGASALAVNTGVASASLLEVSSDVVRIATDAAGAGLTGGGGSALAVGAGNGITVNANDVALASSTGGAGLTYTTGVLAVGAGSGITVNADDVALASSTAGNGLTYSTGVLAVGAGTGISVAADAVAVDTSVVVRKYSASIGNGSSTSIAVTHNLGTKDVTWSLRRNSDDVFVYTDAVATDTNTLTLTFPSAPSSNQYRIIVHG